MLAAAAASDIACVAEVSTGLTMMALAPEAMKFLIWSSCLATSSCASSTCSSTPGMPLACSTMPLRSTVRKLSSNNAMDTPIFSAWAAVLIRAAANAPITNFFMSVFLHKWGVRRRPGLPDVPEAGEVAMRKMSDPGGKVMFVAFITRNGTSIPISYGFVKRDSIRDPVLMDCLRADG